MVYSNILIICKDSRPLNPQISSMEVVDIPSKLFPRNINNYGAPRGPENNKALTYLVYRLVGAFNTHHQ